MIAANKAAKLFGAPAFAIPFSAEERIGKEALTERIGQIFIDAEAQAQRHMEAELLFAQAEVVFAEMEQEEGE